MSSKPRTTDSTNTLPQQDNAAGTKSRRLAVVFALAGALFIAAGVTVIPGLVTQWEPCFASPSYDTRECLQLQTDFSYTAVFALWGVVAALAFAIASVVIAVHRFRRFRRVAIVALGVVLLGNVLTDYVMAPVFNGGYFSHDSAPGMGYWAAGSIIACGSTLIVGPLFLSPVRKRGIAR